MVAINKIVEEHEFRYTTTGADEAKRKADALGASIDKLAGSEERSSASTAKAAKTKLTAAAAMERFQRQTEMEVRMYRDLRAAQDTMQESLEAVADSQMRAAQAAADQAAQFNKAANDNVAAASRQNSAFQTAAKFALEHPVLVAAGVAAASRALGALAGTASVSLAAASVATGRYAAESAAMGGRVAAAASLAARVLSTTSTATAVAGNGLTAFGDKVAGLGGVVGLFARGLGAIGPHLGAIALGFLAISAASDALNKAFADYEKLVALGKQAQELDLSAPFLKSFKGLGAQFRVETEQMQAALQQASGFLRERYGQAGAATRVFGEVDPGGTLRASQQLALAQSTEQRIKAVLAGMVELEARGERLAAINVGEKVFGTALIDRLRTGERSIAQFVDELERAKNREILSQADVARALALEEKITDVKREIDEAVSATFDFSSAAEKVRGVWLSILVPVKDVAQAIAESVRGGDAATMRRIGDLQGRAQQIETVALPRAIDRGDAAVVESLREQVVGLNAEVDRLSSTMTSAAERIDSAVGRVPPPLRLMSDELNALVNASDSAARGLDGTAASARSAGSAMEGAAVKARGFAEALASIQQANPNLSSTLSLLDRIGKVRGDVAAGVKGITEEFNAGKIGDADGQARIIKLNEQAAASIKAIKTEAEKPFQEYVREAEIGKLDTLGQSLARASDRFADVREKALNYYNVQIEKADTPEARGALESAKVKELARLDAAYKQVGASARKSAADQASKAGGGAAEAGADAYDNALKRARDQIEELKLQASTAGRTTEEVVKLTEANRLRRAADQAGRSGEKGVAEDIDRTAEALAKQKGATEAAIEAHRRLQDGQRELGQDFERFAEDMLIGGSKIADAFKGLAKTFASSGLRSFLTGDGPLAGFMGTASTEKGQLGGLLGGKVDFGKMFDFDKMQKAVGLGSETGISKAFEPLLKPQTNAEGKSMGFASSPLGSGLMSAGVGASIGYSSQSPLMGAVGGGLSGLAMGGPIGGIIGAGAGLLGGLFGQSEAKKAAKKRAAAELQAAKDAYEEAKPQIDALRRTLRGEGNGSVTGQVDAAFTQYRQANFAASKAGDTATASRLTTEFEGYFQRLYVVFQRSFQGTLGEMQAGLGTNGPFAQAAAAVAELGESLKGFVADTKAIVGADLLDASRRAAQESALASLEPAKALSTTQTELGRIRGTAAGLTQVLIDLGMSADAAAVAIQERTAQAMDGLRATFSADLATKTNDALGKSYLNEVANLVKEQQGLLADAAAIGADAAQVEAYFTAAAQKIVDGSELTGDAFEALVRQFPELTGQVHAFTEALDTAAAKAAAATRSLGFQDRLFVAQNDTSTLNGQLAAYDRQARREREDEVKAGGQAMADLEAAQYAERLKIVKDYNAQAAAATKQTLDQARTAFDTFARSIRDYLDGLNAGSQSTLSPADRLAAARQTYADRLTAAQGGDRDALDGITGNATNRLDAARAYYGSSQGYQDELAQVKASLALLPKQVSAEQFIVNAVEAAADTTVTALQVMQESLRTGLALNSPVLIAEALTTNFDGLDRNIDGLLSKDEFLAGLGPLATKAEQDAAEELFRSIDLNGDGQLDKLELLRVQLLAGLDANSPGSIAAALSASFGMLDTSVNGLLDYGEFSAGLGPLATKAEQDRARAIFDSIDANGDDMLSALELLRTSLKGAIEANSPSALAQALGANFTALDTSVNGLLSYDELVAGLGPLATKAEQQAAKTVFDAIDANGDGQLDRLELVRARAAGIETQAGLTKEAVATSNDIANQQKAVLENQARLADQQAQVLGAIKSIQDASKTTLLDSKGLLQAISELSSLQRDQLTALNRQFSVDQAITINGVTLDNNMVTALNKIVFNTAGTYSKLTDGKQAPAYASGGWVSGPGTGTSDSISAMLSNGEFVVQAAAAKAYGPILEAMNDNTFAMPTLGLPMPVPSGADAGDFAAMVSELRALRAEVAALRGDVREGTDVAEQGHMLTASEVRRNTSVVEDGNATASRQALKKAS